MLQTKCDSRSQGEIEKEIMNQLLCEECVVNGRWGDLQQRQENRKGQCRRRGRALSLMHDVDVNSGGLNVSDVVVDLVRLAELGS